MLAKKVAALWYSGGATPRITLERSAAKSASVTPRRTSGRGLHNSWMVGRRGCGWATVANISPGQTCGAAAIIAHGTGPTRRTELRALSNETSRLLTCAGATKSSRIRNAAEDPSSTSMSSSARAAPRSSAFRFGSNGFRYTCRSGRLGRNPQNKPRQEPGNCVPGLPILIAAVASLSSLRKSWCVRLFLRKGKAA